MTWKPDNEINDAENFSAPDVFLTEKANVKSAIDQRLEELARARGKAPMPAGMSAPELLKKRLDELHALKAEQELAALEQEAQRNHLFGTWS